MSKEELPRRHLQLRNLVVMALADGSIGEREVNLIAQRCAELGLDEHDLQKAIEYGLNDDAALELPTNPVERDSIMRDLIRMMAADGVLDEGEKRLFALAAARMSMSADDVDRLIDETLSGRRCGTHLDHFGTDSPISRSRSLYHQRLQRTHGRGPGGCSSETGAPSRHCQWSGVDRLPTQRQGDSRGHDRRNVTGGCRDFCRL